MGCEYEGCTATVMLVWRCASTARQGLTLVQIFDSPQALFVGYARSLQTKISEKKRLRLTAQVESGRVEGPPARLYVQTANVGDSSCALGRVGESSAAEKKHAARFLTVEHKVTAPAERERLAGA